VPLSDRDNYLRNARFETGGCRAPFISGATWNQLSDLDDVCAGTRPSSPASVGRLLRRDGLRPVHLNEPSPCKLCLEAIDGRGVVIGIRWLLDMRSVHHPVR
jgi:hypothetical protein